jgi:hypothetical protein
MVAPSWIMQFGVSAACIAFNHPQLHEMCQQEHIEISNATSFFKSLDLYGF